MESISTHNPNWHHLKAICDLHNTGKKSDMYQYMRDNNLPNDDLANVCISAFEVDVDNIKQNYDIAQKLVSLKYSGFREQFKAELLKEMFYAVDTPESNYD